MHLCHRKCQGSICTLITCESEKLVKLYLRDLVITEMNILGNQLELQCVKRSPLEFKHADLPIEDWGFILEEFLSCSCHSLFFIYTDQCDRCSCAPQCSPVGCSCLPKVTSAAGLRAAQPPHIASAQLKLWSLVACLLYKPPHCCLAERDKLTVKLYSTTKTLLLVQNFNRLFKGQKEKNLNFFW